MLFKRMRFRIAAEKYGTRLPHWLVNAYGSHHSYTEAQLRRAIEKNDPDVRYLALALAAYMDEEQFERAMSAVSVKMDYAAARQLFIENSPVLIVSRHENAAPPVVLRQLGIE